jgi:hypothetical protein
VKECRTFLYLLVTANFSLSTLAHTPVGSFELSGANIDLKKKPGMLSLTRVLNGNVIAVHCLLARSFCHHVEERNRSSNQECKFKTKSNYNPQYYQKNKDKRAEYMKGYNESHKDTLQAQRSNYRSHRKAKLLQDLASLPELRVGRSREGMQLKIFS